MNNSNVDLDNLLRVIEMYGVSGRREKSSYNAKYKDDNGDLKELPNKSIGFTLLSNSKEEIELVMYVDEKHIGVVHTTKGEDGLLFSGLSDSRIYVDSEYFKKIVSVIEGKGTQVFFPINKPNVSMRLMQLVNNTK